MDMNDLKSGEPFFDDWYIDSYIGTFQSGTAFKIYREQDDLREFSIMKVIEIPRDKYDNCAQPEELEEEVAQYYKELVTDVYRKIRLLENLPDRQHIVSYEDHLIYQLDCKSEFEIYIRMEYLGDFGESIDASFMTYQDVILLGKNICEALDICERYHIIHGGISPNCIYLSEHGQYKLGDFSLFSLQGNTEDKLQEIQQDFFEFSDYIAPEIIAFEGYDKRADIYSLGLVLYTCLNNNQLPSDFVDKPLPMCGPKELGQVILKACEVRPEKRYQSAKEFQEALIAISVFLGDSLTEQVYSGETEESEIYVAATQEENSEHDDILHQEQAYKQLQKELQQELKSELGRETVTVSPKEAEDLEQTNDKLGLNKKRIGKRAILGKNIEKEKDEFRVSLVSLKRTKNMGPWILAIWTTVLTIAVLILLLKSEFTMNTDKDTAETMIPASVVSPTEQESLTEGETDNLGSDSDTNTPPEKEPVVLLYSGEELTSLKDIELLKEAKVMDFSNNSISDLSALNSSVNVETLKLNQNMISDVRPLKKLASLKELDLSSNRIVTIVSLKGLTNLEVLSLSNNRLPNILGLEKLTKLKMLYLDGNDIEDVSKLTSLKNLIFLDISNNRIKEKEILKLQKALPNCIINY